MEWIAAESDRFGCRLPFLGGLPFYRRSDGGKVLQQQRRCVLFWVCGTTELFTVFVALYTPGSRAWSASNKFLLVFGNRRLFDSIKYLSKVGKPIFLVDIVWYFVEINKYEIIVPRDINSSLPKIRKKNTVLISIRNYRFNIGDFGNGCNSDSLISDSHFSTSGYQR